MQTEIEFEPEHNQPKHTKRVALISSGFFLFVQLAFLDGLPAQLAFTVVFAGFLFMGLRISNQTSQTWPKKITLNKDGIRYADLKPRHGIDLIPWSEIDQLDLFYNQHNMAPFLRIGLRQGKFRQRLKQPRMQRLSLGLDVNIPVAVNVEPEVVLQTAEQFWTTAKLARG